MAKKLTASTEEAETATQEIFLDLWKHADRFDYFKHDEINFVVLIARRWLLKNDEIGSCLRRKIYIKIRREFCSRVQLKTTGQKCNFLQSREFP